MSLGGFVVWPLIKEGLKELDEGKKESSNWPLIEEGLKGLNKEEKESSKKEGELNEEKGEEEGSEENK